MRLRDVVGVLRSVDRLLSLEDKYTSAMEDLTRDLEALTLRVTRLEAREEIVVAEAKAAAGTAAAMVAMQSIADISRRIGRMEERSDQQRLAP